MKCHGSNNDNNGHQNHKGHMSHMWMMVLCCAIPIVLLLALPFLGFGNNAGWLTGAIFLLCPLLHILMMPLMMRKGNNQENNQSHEQIEHQPKQLETNEEG